MLPRPRASDVESTIPLTGSPVAFVKVPDDGVPSAGVVNVGLVSVLFVRVSVPVRVTKLSSLRAVLNSAVVPLRVLLVSEIVLLVSVSLPARDAKSAKSVLELVAA